MCPAHRPKLRLIAQTIGATSLLLSSTVTAMAQAPTYGYQVISTYPHDTSAFTQGLVLLNGTLYESTGLYGESSLREVDLRSGAVLRHVALESQYFGEGMTIFQGKIFQLTWREQTGLIYDFATFGRIGEFFYAGEGWGLTHDEQHLIMSDGTNEIRFLDPSTFQVVRSIRVLDEGSPVTNINELEYINGEIYANVWLTNWIVRIHPATGAVLGWIDMTGLFSSGDVLNGIAYDAASGHLLVTGKWWPSLFEVRVVGGQAPVADAQSVSTPEDAWVPIALTARDADDDALTFRIVQDPAHGTLSGAPPLVSYAPAADYHGLDTFTFEASDGTFDSNIAAVSVTVTAVNDRPVAVSESYTTSPNTVLTVASPGVLGNDSDVDGDALTAGWVTAPSQGVLTLSASGSFVYTPATNYSGPDSFTYSSSDGLETSSPVIVSLMVTVPAGTPQVTLSSTSLSFGSQPVGTVSTARVVTLTNGGPAPLIIDGITVTGPDASDFAQANSCGGSVAPGAACAIDVTFRPSGKGTRRAAISIVDNAPSSPHTIALSGTGKKQGR